MRIKLHLIAVAAGITMALVTGPVESLHAQQGPAGLLSECTASLTVGSGLNPIEMGDDPEAGGLYALTNYKTFFQCSPGDTSNCGVCMRFILSNLGACFNPAAAGTVMRTVNQPAGTPSCGGTWRSSGIVMVKRITPSRYYKLQVYATPKPCPPFDINTWTLSGSQIYHSYGVGVIPPC